MNKRFALLALALAAAPLAASADELSYSYLEGGYAQVDLEGEKGDGFQLRGSAAIGELAYVYGGYGVVEAEDYNVELAESQIGLGLRHALSERADFIGELGYVRHEVEVSDVLGLTGSGSVDGGRLSVGFRGMLADNFEGWVKASYNDGGDFDGAFSGVLGAQLKLSPMMGLVAEIESGELIEDADTTKYMIGLRASF